MSAKSGYIIGSLDPIPVGAGANGRVETILIGEHAERIDAATLKILERRRSSRLRSRGWLVRRALALSDVLGLAVAFVGAQVVFGGANDSREYVAFFLTLPAWVVLATLYGLYERDEERAYHTTVDDVSGIFNFVTTGVWLMFASGWATGLIDVEPKKLMTFWGLAVVLVTVGRSVARACCRRNITYLQNTVIVGAGDVGQLVAQKLIRHPEYGLNLVGVVDAEPKARHPGIDHVALLGSADQLPEIIRTFDVERVIIAFSREPAEATLEVVRSVNNLNIQVDIVPRLFELVGPRVAVHAIEGVPVVGLRPPKLSRRNAFLKRSVDLVGATVALLLTAPVFALIALWIKRDSPGPVFFRQERLSTNMKTFSVLKFRTMKVGTSPDAHRDYIKTALDPDRSKTVESANGLYKAAQEDRLTRAGKRLREMSLDELPQLINVLRGEMSLVGPRPVPAYETEHYAPRHFERFLVPAGMTGLWQVTARAKATWREALDMDVAYVRGWSLGLDLRLLWQTPFTAFFRKGTN